jgi:hypothetical protein
MLTIVAPVDVTKAMYHPPEYIDYDSRVRTHQGIDQVCPVPWESAATDRPIGRQDILGGIVHDDLRGAA